MGSKVPCKNCRLDKNCTACGLVGCHCITHGVGLDPATGNKHSRLLRIGTGERKYENESKNLGGPKWLRWYCTKCNARNYSSYD